MAPRTPYGLAAAALFAIGSVAMEFAHRRLSRGRTPLPGLAAAALLGGGGFAVELAAHVDADPRITAYGAVVHVVLLLDGVLLVAGLALVLFAAARRLAGRLDAVRRVTFDNSRLLWHALTAQALTGLALVHGFPRLVG
jgi:cytochrome c oxidase subunit I+III